MHRPAPAPWRAGRSWAAAPRRARPRWGTRSCCPARDPGSSARPKRFENLPTPGPGGACPSRRTKSLVTRPRPAISDRCAPRSYFQAPPRKPSAHRPGHHPRERAQGWSDSARSGAGRARRRREPLATATPSRKAAPRAVSCATPGGARGGPSPSRGQRAPHASLQGRTRSRAARAARSSCRAPSRRGRSPPRRPMLRQQTPPDQPLWDFRRSARKRARWPLQSRARNTAIYVAARTGLCSRTE
mmetsp:Transcript_71887/g.186968  ORF Transcript_71887/g.186968 Transcript_71887/m.186968 type:complete len:244 (+) Transcript_71887:488-1219(+)